MTTTEAITSATFRRNLFPEGGVSHVPLTHSSSDGELDKIGQDSVFKHHAATASHSNEETCDNDNEWQTRTAQLPGEADASAMVRNDVDSWNEWCIQSSGSGKKATESPMVSFRSMENLLLPELQMGEKKASLSWQSKSALSSMRCRDIQYHVRDREHCRARVDADYKPPERSEHFSSSEGRRGKVDNVTSSDVNTVVSGVKFPSEGTKISRWSAPDSPTTPSRDAGLGSENTSAPHLGATGIGPTNDVGLSAGMDGGAFEFFSQMMDLPEGFADAAAPGDTISFIAFPRSNSGGVQGFRMDSELAAELASATGAPGAAPGEEDSARLFSGEQSSSWGEQNSRGMLSLQSGAILRRADGSTVLLMPPKLQISPPLQRTKSILLVKSSAAGVEERRDRSERGGKSVRWRDSHGQLLASIREFDTSELGFSEYDYDLDEDDAVCCGCCTVS